MRRFATIAGLSTLSALTYSFVCQTPSKSPQTQIPTFKSRSQHLQEVQANPQYDVVVIGGGCNGAGVLLDASTRGLRTLLIQKDDFASGATSKSTKLIHGGVRYLQQVFDMSLASLSSRLQKFQLVKQAIVERGLMIDSASHLTSKIPFVIPCENMFYSVYYYLGSLVYYWIYSYYSDNKGTQFAMPYFVNRLELTEIFPMMNQKFSSGVVYEDGSFNDARLLVTAILTATVGNGMKMPETFVPANAVNRAEFIDFIKDQNGVIKGVIFKDLMTDKQYKIDGKYVVNCTGAWADTIRLKDNPKLNKRLCMVAGSHIVYDNHIASSSFGLASPSKDGRIVLVQPWLGRVLAGTTQRTLTEPTNNPTCSEEERKFINDSMMDLMSKVEVGPFMYMEKTRWSGIRPLVAENAENLDTKSISRSHVIEESDSGLLSLMGGKWTIYRKMGEDLVNIIAQKQKEKGKQLPASPTAGLKLLGSAPVSLRQALVKEKGDIGGQLYSSFGWMSKEVAKGDLTRVYGSTTMAQLQWIVKNQLVSNIEDVLMRRTRLCFLTRKADFLPLCETVGRLLQKQHKWSQSRTKKQIKEAIEKLLSYEFE